MSIEDCKRIIRVDTTADKEYNREMLAIYSESHSADVREEIIKANIKMAAEVALGMTSLHPEKFDDYFGYACEGLIRAVDKFDPTVGVEFSSYACEAMRKTIIQWQKRELRYMDHIADVQILDAEDDGQEYAESFFVDEDNNPEKIMVEYSNKELLSRAYHYLSYRNEVAVKSKFFGHKEKSFQTVFNCSRESYRIASREGLKRMRNMIDWNFSLAAIFGFDENAPDELVMQRLMTFPKSARMFLYSAFGLKGFEKLTDQQLSEAYLDFSESKTRNVQSILQILTRELNKDVKKIQMHERPVRSVNADVFKTLEQIVENLDGIGALPKNIEDMRVAQVDR